jgi:nicotinate-nucleotide pyrophosphorylase
MQAFEGMIGTLAAVENELMGVAEQFPGVAPLLRQAVNSIRQAAAQIVGTAQTGSSQPFLPIRG